MSDYLERLEARFAEYRFPMFSDEEYDDLRAALDELKQLRAQRMFLDGQVFVSGWYAHAEASASLGWDAREAAWRKYREEMAETLAKAVPQQPDSEDGDRD